MNNKQNWKLFVLTKACIVTSILLLSIQAICAYVLAYESIPKRLCNKKRKRDDVIAHIEEYDDREFKSMTGLSRKTFNYVLSLIRPKLKRNHDMAIRSSGSPVPTMLKLFIHQRLMKGAKTHDMDWLGVDFRHVWESEWKPVATAIDQCLDNVKFKYNDATNINFINSAISMSTNPPHTSTNTPGNVLQAMQHLQRRDLSAYRRLQMTVAIQRLGLRFTGPDLTFTNEEHNDYTVDELFLVLVLAFFVLRTITSTSL